jgi:hypothetical protein
MGHTKLVEVLLDHRATIGVSAALAADYAGHDDIVLLLCSKLGYGSLAAMMERI